MPGFTFFTFKLVLSEDFPKDESNKWKDKIDPRVYEALMIWEVEGTD